MEEKIVRSPRKTSKLLEILGIKSKYKIHIDESLAYVDSREEKEIERIWCEYIPAYRGSIYLSSASPLELAFFSESIGKINTIEKKLQSEKIDVKIVKLDGEGIIYFKAKYFKQVARLAGAKRGRKISEEHKQKLLAARDKKRKQEKGETNG